MKWAILALVCFAVCLGLLASCGWVSEAYEHSVYRYEPIGEYMEPHSGISMDRQPVKAIPVYEPDNPEWVETLKAVAPILSFVSFGLGGFCWSRARALPRHVK